MLDVNSVQSAVMQSETLINDLMAASSQLACAIEEEMKLRQMLRDAEQALEMAEAKVLYEAELAAQEKSGALAGIAKTSPAYRAAVTHLLAHERQSDGPVGIYSRKVAHLRTRLDDAQVAREQAAVHFSACKHAADLKASILRAMVL